MHDALTTADLWHAAGRVARDDRKRLVALQAVLLTAPALVLGALAFRLVDQGPAAAVERIADPWAFITGPLVEAWWLDRDLALLAYVVLQATLLTALWSWFGTVLHRLAAVDLARGRKAEAAAAIGFARRHVRAALLARLAFGAAVVVPLVLAVAVSLVGRIDGWVGGLLVAVAAAAVALLVLAAVVAGSIAAAAGFTVGPAVAYEGSDVFDAVSRPLHYASASLPRLVGWRLLFLGRVALGAGWRGLRAAAVVALGWLCLSVGAGPDRVGRAVAILGAFGRPADADRLGVVWSDYALAAVVVFVLAAALALWLADLATRVVCARSAVYLLVRRAVDGVGCDAVVEAGQEPVFRDAEAAGFVEVGRVGSGSRG